MGQERLNTGYLRTVMEARGMRFGSAERTRALLAGLVDEERSRIAVCLKQVSAGVESAVELEAISAIGYATSDDVHARLSGCGLVGVPLPTLYRWLTATPDGLKRIADASAGGSAERQELADSLGVSLAGEHEAPAQGADGWTEPQRRMGGGPTVREDAQPMGASEAPRKGRQRVDQGGDHAISYARDEAPVKAAAAAKHHVYVKSAALTFEIDKLRRSEEGRRFTVRVEAAKGKDGKAYDWERKAVVQLTAEELHQAAAVVLGMSDHLVLRHHGENRDKGLELRRENGSIMVRITMTGFSVAVPVGADHLYKVGLVFVRALSFNDPDVDLRVILDTLRLTSAVVRVNSR